jgi:hypothetical protein
MSVIEILRQLWMALGGKSQLAIELFVMVGSRRTVAKWLVLVALVPAWWLSAPLRGYLTAEFDLLRGTYAVLGYGLSPSWRPEYARLLRERYGVQYRPVAGCVVSQDLVVRGCLQPCHYGSRYAQIRT